MSEIVEFVDEVCGLYFRSVLLPDAGMRAPQHTHDYDHATLIGSGAARLYVDGVCVGEFMAGSAVPIKAGKYHTFESTEPSTRLTCVHDVASATSLKQRGL